MYSYTLEIPFEKNTTIHTSIILPFIAKSGIQSVFFNRSKTLSRFSFASSVIADNILPIHQRETKTPPHKFRRKCGFSGGFGRPFDIWFIILRLKSFSASSANLINCIRFPKPVAEKNVNPPLVEGVTIVNKEVSVVVLSQFFVVVRKHLRRFLLNSHARNARNHQCIALAD